MTKPPTSFLSGIPTTVAVVSKALGRAMHRLAFEILNAIYTSMLRFTQWSWRTYRKVESRLASLICDIVLTIYAFRFFAVIVGIGVALGIWRRWLILAVYVAVILIAVLFYFRPNEEDSHEADTLNRRYRAWLIPIVEWALRLSVVGAWSCGFYVISSGKLTQFVTISLRETDHSVQSSPEGRLAVPEPLGHSQPIPIERSLPRSIDRRNEPQTDSAGTSVVTVTARSLVGHRREVYTVVFSPDGRQLASGGSDGTIKLWDPVSGTLLRTLKERLAWNLVFSPDGRQLASGSGEGMVKIWDPASGSLLRSFSGYDGHPLAFSPDGRQLAFTSRKVGIRIWDPASGNLLRTLKGPNLGALVFSPDGRQLASAGSPNITLWDPASGSLLRSFSGYDGYALAFSPDGRQLAFTSRKVGIRIWDPVSGILLRTLKGHTDIVKDFAFSPDGRQLAAAAGGSDGTIKLWDPATGNLVHTLRGHTDLVEDIVFSPDGRHLASTSVDLTIKLWDPASGSLLRTLKGHPRVWSIRFSPDGRQLVSNYCREIITVWQLQEK